MIIIIVNYKKIKKNSVNSAKSYDLFFILGYQIINNNYKEPSIAIKINRIM
jgi:hypothetical protein